MTEKEKSLKGLIYDPFCEGMQEERTRAHRLCLEYNQTTEEDVEKRRKILDELLPNVDKSVYLQGPIQFDYGSRVKIGENSYANFNFTCVDVCPIIIGKNVFMGPNVSIYSPKHPMCYQDRNLYFYTKTKAFTDKEYGAPVEIKDNCWICGSVVICGGVTIGEGCVIGAGSVVTRDIPPNSFAAGNPCRVIRQITEKDRLENHPELFEKE